SLGIFDPSLGIFYPARCRRNPDFWGGFPPKPRSVLRNRQGIPRLSRVSSRACEGKTRNVIEQFARGRVDPMRVLEDHQDWPAKRQGFELMQQCFEQHLSLALRAEVEAGGGIRQ